MVVKIKHWICKKSNEKKKQKKNGNHFFPASLDTYGKYKG